jgi:hypothetical protein
MKFEEYFKGIGLDVSREYVLKNCEHFFVEPNNLYSLKKFVDFESLNFIYSKNLINETKFYRILIKEWLNFCRVGGYIIISMKSNKILNFNQLIKECGLLIQDKGEIVEIRQDSLVIKKTKSILKKGDSIDKWSFGILTNGKRDKEVDREINSIINQKIPHFEVIICGAYGGKFKKMVKKIDFNPEVLWITKKKNLICEKAKYENLVITHDRFEFDSWWYEGIKKYGNYFEVLSCVIKNPCEERIDDWVAFGEDKDFGMGIPGTLNYVDWDKNGYISGGFYILKKSVWEKCPWDNSIGGTGKPEDAKLSMDFYKKGFVARFNIFSSCKTIVEREKWFNFKFNKKRFISSKDRPFLNRLKNMIKLFCAKYILTHESGYTEAKKIFITTKLK